MEDSLRQMLALAQERLDATDDPYQRDQLRKGIRLSEQLLTLFESIRPVAREQAEHILAAFAQGGLFGGDNGRSSDDIGFGFQD